MSRTFFNAFCIFMAALCFIVSGTVAIIILFAVLSAPSHAQVLPLPAAQVEKDMATLSRSLDDMAIRKPVVTPRLQETLDRLMFRDMLTKLHDSVRQQQTIMHTPCGSEK